MQTNTKMNIKNILLATILGATLMVSSATLAEGIGDISMRFCNTDQLPKTLELNAEGGTAQDICMEFYNQGKQETQVKFGFVDGIITNDSEQHKACKNEGDTADFGQFVESKTTKIKVPPLGSARTKATFTLPEGKAGEVHGCVTYFIEKVGKSTDMLNIMVRKANFVDILLSGNIKVGFGFNGNMTTAYDKANQQIIAEAKIENQGNVSETTSIVGTLKGLFGFQKVFLTENRTIFPKQISTITSSIKDLPRYGGIFTAQYDITHNPVTNTGDLVTISQKASVTILNTTVLIITGAILGFIAIIALLIVLLLKKNNQSATTKTSTRKK